MIVSKLASAIYNDIQGGLAGYEATINISLEQLEDEVVEERLLFIKKYSLQNLIPRKDLFYSLNCIEVDCKSMDKCCDVDLSPAIAHFEIPQIVNDFGEEAIDFIGSVNREIDFKVYTSKSYRYHKYRTRGKNKPYVYVDTTPNEHNYYDCYIFNAPMLLRISITAIFKDPRLVSELACCNFTDADNITWIATEVKESLIKKKMAYYKLNYPQVFQPNNQVPK